MHVHVFGPNFQKKAFCFNFLIQLFNSIIYLFIYLYFETKLIIIFQGIILHTDIVF